MSSLWMAIIEVLCMFYLPDLINIWWHVMETMLLVFVGILVMTPFTVTSQTWHWVTMFTTWLGICVALTNNFSIIYYLQPGHICPNYSNAEFWPWNLNNPLSTISHSASELRDFLLLKEHKFWTIERFISQSPT